MRRCLAIVLTTTGFAATGCGDVQSRKSGAGADAGEVEVDGGGGAAVDAGPCAPCAAEALCDPAAPDPCTCRPGHAGDGTTCVSVVPDLHGARLEVPCSPPSVPGMDGCTSLLPEAWTTTAGGEAGAAYRVTIRVRGVLEHKFYAGGEGVGEFRTGGVPDDTTWNVYRLQVADTVHHLNAGESSERHCYLIDYRADISVAAGDEVSLAQADADGLMIVNIDDSDPPTPIVVPDIAPYPAAFDGQFLQIDVESVELDP